VCLFSAAKVVFLALQQIEASLAVLDQEGSTLSSHKSALVTILSHSEVYSH
jgi:hypothetical protein